MEKFLLEDQEARYNALMAEHDREVARKIFEEIDGIIDYDNFPIAHQKLVSAFAELKKKFVPDTNDGRKTESEDKP